MERNTSAKFTLNTGTDLAFALVVFISFFATFSNATISSPFLITVIIFLGIAYITNGIYGFAFASKTGKNSAKLIYFCFQLLLGGMIVYYGKGAGFNALILLPLVAHSAMLLDQDWILMANIGIILTFSTSVYLYSHNLSIVWDGAPIFFVGQVFILIFTQMAVTELRAREKLETLAAQLSEANKHLSEYAERVKELTITQERNRMAREIHDGLGHYLTTINMQIQAAIKILEKDRGKANHLLDTALHLTSEALLDVRNSVFALRQDPNELVPLFKRIENLAKTAYSTEKVVDLKMIGDAVAISPQSDLTLYRAAQELINNANKHSKAQRVNLILDYSDPKTISLSCSDNGVGSLKNEHGFGLLGIHERVRLLDGTMTINNEKGKGFEVSLKIPKIE